MGSVKDESKEITKRLNEVCYLYKYDKKHVERNYSVTELGDFYINALRVESMFRGIDLKLPDTSHLKKERQEHVKHIGKLYG